MFAIFPSSKHMRSAEVNEWRSSKGQTCQPEYEHNSTQHHVSGNGEEVGQLHVVVHQAGQGFIAVAAVVHDGEVKVTLHTHTHRHTQSHKKHNIKQIKVNISIIVSTSCCPHFSDQPSLLLYPIKIPKIISRETKYLALCLQPPLKKFFCCFVDFPPVWMWMKTMWSAEKPRVSAPGCVRYQCPLWHYKGLVCPCQNHVLLFKAICKEGAANDALVSSLGNALTMSRLDTMWWLTRMNANNEGVDKKKISKWQKRRLQLWGKTVKMISWVLEIPLCQTVQLWHLLISVALN